jgi:hypothetical protein
VSDPSRPGRLALLLLLGLLQLAGSLAAVVLAGCVVYETAPGVYVPATPASFDRSWSAALGAFDDQGVRITSQDRSTGQIRGTRDGIDLVANVRPQADGTVRVEFNTSGATARDPTLIDRVSRAYDRRMGR